MEGMRERDADFVMRVYVCMNLLIGKGQITQKDRIRAKIEKTAKFMNKCRDQVLFCVSLIDFWMHAAPVPMRLWVVNFSGY